MGELILSELTQHEIIGEPSPAPPRERYIISKESQAINAKKYYERHKATINAAHAEYMRRVVASIKDNEEFNKTKRTL